MDYIEKFKERLDALNKYSADSNFSACSNISTDLIRVSDFMSFSEGVFIGEFFESMFENLRYVVDNFEFKPEEIEPIKSEIVNLVGLLRESIPTADERTKSHVYDTLAKVRSKVTNFQVSSHRERKRKKMRPHEEIVFQKARTRATE